MMASAQKYGHVNTAELFQLMPELKGVTARLDSLNKQYEDLLVNMQEEYQKKAQEYEQKAATMTDAMKQIQEEELYTMQQRLQTTYQTAQQDIAQKRQEYVAPVQEKMLKAIQAVGQEKGFTYIFDTAAILNRPASVAVDSRGGTASIAHWLNNYFRLTGEHAIDKNDPLIVEMRKRVDDLYAQGRNTVMGDEELEIMVRRCDTERYEHLLFHKSK